MTTPNIETKLTSQTNGAQGGVVQAQPSDTDEVPWYELINDAPEPPEDAMQQASTISYITGILHERYSNCPTVLVSEQTNVIYDSAVPGSVIVPDFYVIFGVDAVTIETYRRSYRIDEWGVPPTFVLEVASASTVQRDLSVKRELYAQMGAQEYWRFDRYTKYYGEPLVGERLVDGKYVRFDLHTEPNGDMWSRSEALGVDFYFRPMGDIGRFLLYDFVKGEWLTDLGEERKAHAETKAARQAAEVRAQDAEARAQSSETARQAAEAEIERLRRRLREQ